MLHRIRCWTLFDITHTGILNRLSSTESVNEEWIHRRNTQCNFDTILQIISLRSQPDVVHLPEMINCIDHSMFGEAYSENETLTCWKFDFEVHHSEVFTQNGVKFAALYEDCEGVPMIHCKIHGQYATSFLTTAIELKNIHFEEI